MVICGRVVGGRLGTFLGMVVSVTDGSLVWGVIWRILEVIWLVRGFLALLLLHLSIFPSIQHLSIYLITYLGAFVGPLGKLLGSLSASWGLSLGGSWGPLVSFVPASSKHPNPKEQISI